MCVRAQSCCLGAIFNSLCHQRDCVKRNNGCFGEVAFTVLNQLYGVRCLESEVFALIIENEMHYNRKAFVAALKWSWH